MNQIVVSWVKQAQKGNKESFAKVIHHIEKKAYGMAFSYLKEPEDSMDAVCDSVEIAFKKLRSLKKPEYFETWFIKIVINQSLKILNKRQRQQLIQEKIVGQSEALTYQEGQQDSLAMDAEDKLMVQQELDQLQPDQQQVIRLRFYQGLKLKEIGGYLGVPLSTVKTKLYSGLKKIKNNMERCDRHVR